nr:MAG TPA: hypothetical protein [Caudoviricetes sp.]
MPKIMSKPQPGNGKEYGAQLREGRCAGSVVQTESPLDTERQ